MEINIHVSFTILCLFDMQQYTRKGSIFGIPICQIDNFCLELERICRRRLKRRHGQRRLPPLHPVCLPHRGLQLLPAQN